MQDGVKIMIGPEAKKSVMESLDADVAFLAKNQIMDYSLILGKDTKTFKDKIGKIFIHTVIL